MATFRALVVDDERTSRRLLEKGARASGFEVTAAEDGSQAAELISENVYDVVLTDLVMPGGVDGLGVLEAAKATAIPPAVFVVTGHASVETAVSAMKLGAEDYLQKPVYVDEVKVRLDKVREHRALMRDADDLREAMDATEKGAAQTIGELEKLIFRYETQREKAVEILARQDIDSDERVRAAREALSDPCEG